MKQTALVTGASGGIGADLARLLAAGGCDLVLLARSTGALESLANELSRAHGIAASVVAADLSEPGGVDRVARTIAERRLAIDILINNAAFGALGEFAKQNSEEQLRMLQLNVTALTMLTRYLLPPMLERQRGKILNVASTAAFQAGPLMAVYYASKAYVVSLSMALSEETEGTGVTVTCLCPGPTRTGFQQRAQMENSRMLERLGMMASADVARIGYEAMMAGRPLVVTGLMNRLGVQALRLLPRRLAARLVKALHAESGRGSR